MSLFDFFKSSGQEESQILKTRPTDDFANTVLIELKSVATDALRLALEQQENRYIRSILDESYFTLESLVVTPKDFEVSKKLEDFLITHEAVDPDFRKVFFQQIVQSEYRTQRGATLRVSSDFCPTIEFDNTSLESLTQEEGFQVSLKGRRVQFEAIASLGGPFKKVDAVAPYSSRDWDPLMSGKPDAIKDTGMSRAAGVGESTSGAVAQVAIHDARGLTSQIVKLPVLIGREGGAVESSNLHWSDVRVQATYVSRQQLCIVDLLGSVYFFVPESASLTCRRADQSVLEKLRLYPLKSGTVERLSLGVDPAYPLREDPRKANHAEFSIIELSLDEDGESINQGTPRPRAV